MEIPIGCIQDRRATLYLIVDREGNTTFRQTGFPGVEKMKEELLKVTSRQLIKKKQQAYHLLLFLFYQYTAITFQPIPLAPCSFSLAVNALAFSIAAASSS